jgi:hypothetical protein
VKVPRPKEKTVPHRAAFRGPCLAAALLLVGSLATAQEYITVKGPLSDDDFFRLVTCAAPPGEPCQKTAAQWSSRKARDLTFAIVYVAEGFPTRLQAKIDEGLVRGAKELNAAGTGLRIRRAAGSEKPDIFVRLLDIPEGATIRGTGVPEVDGVTIGAATNTIIWNNNRKLTACHITSSNNAFLDQVVSGMVEELTQCLGFNTDIGGRYYEERSIFSESSNALVRLGEQDLMALRRLYP